MPFSRRRFVHTLGMFSLGGQPDSALIQQRVQLHPAFAAVSYKGIPDVRVILYRDEPAMAMLRLPTKQSGGRANLHQGGIGTGIDLDTGVTNHAVQRNRFVERHPDTAGRSSACGCRTGARCWSCRARCRRRSAWATSAWTWSSMPSDGPMLLEANARPGLAIQIANGRGLMPRLEAIDAMLRPAAAAARSRRRRPLPLRQVA